MIIIPNKTFITMTLQSVSCATSMYAALSPWFGLLVKDIRKAWEHFAYYPTWLLLRGLDCPITIISNTHAKQYNMFHRWNIEYH